ncbi:NUDIX domain-containing protein [Brachybacterium sp. AOP25-B2-12]|uniref:NUDIX domain-containing protein n=1 Tax=Brachybacterium sp. AOP25-B2-12 TaxID=3457710 RepID=UPI0040335D43
MTPEAAAPSSAEDPSDPRAHSPAADPQGSRAHPPAATAALDDLERAQSPAIDPALRERFLALVREHPEALLRDGGPRHLTASAIVVDGPGEHVALVWHAKGRFWVQPGGHLDPGETTFESAARREVREETGLDDLERLGRGPAMLHAHALSAAFGRCREHWDVQLLLRGSAPASALPLAPSGETPQVIWVPWPRDAQGRRATPQVPPGTVPDLARTLTALGPVLDEALG